ncbi:unnamed protein product [Boreogadus saida]
MLGLRPRRAPGNLRGPPDRQTELSARPVALLLFGSAAPADPFLSLSTAPAASQTKAPELWRAPRLPSEGPLLQRPTPSADAPVRGDSRPLDGWADRAGSGPGCRALRPADGLSDLRGTPVNGPRAPCRAVLRDEPSEPFSKLLPKNEDRASSAPLDTRTRRSGSGHLS